MVDLLNFLSLISASHQCHVVLTIEKLHTPEGEIYSPEYLRRTSKQKKFNSSLPFAIYFSMASSSAHIYQNNYQRSLHTSEYMSLLFRHHLALKTEIDSPPRMPTPPPCVSETFDAECRNAVQHLIAAFLMPSMFSELILQMPRYS